MCGSMPTAHAQYYATEEIRQATAKVFRLLVETDPIALHYMNPTRNT